MNSAAVPPDVPTPNEEQSRVAPARGVSKLPLYIMTAVVVLVVVLVVLFAAFRGNTEYDAGTPEAALQEFLVATIEDGDVAAMSALMTQRTRGRCSDELRGSRPTDYWSTGYRAELEDMTVRGSTATAVVRLRKNNNDPFDGSSYSFERDFTLQAASGGWLIDTASWPNDLRRCSGGN